jgi:hypothetical protein
MSYLDIPRIHFGGRFFTDPSTVNNDPAHYDPDVTNPSPWQTPLGQHRFEFVNCQVTSVMGPKGFVADDPLVGTPITTVVSTVMQQQNPADNVTPKTNPASISPAKIVDIDVYQQGLSCIYGLKITLSDGTNSVTGHADPPTLNHCWLNSVIPTRSWQDADYDQDSFGGDMNACGSFQTVLRINEAEWPPSTSPILNLLKSTTQKLNGQYLVSFKFVVDGFRNVPQDMDPLTGRIVGTLGPVMAGEPLYNLGQRWLMPRAFSKSDPWNSPSFNDCPFKVDAERGKLVFDLANSICRQTAGGEPVDLGILSVIVTTDEPVVSSLGTIDYSAFSYSHNAHITELDLNSGQIELIKKGKLGLVTSYTNIGAQKILSEAETDIQFAVEVRQLNMEGNTGNKQTRTVYISRNGVPLAGKQLNVFVESTHGGMPGVTAGPNDKGNTPQADGAITASIGPSNSAGFATVTITVLKDPGYRTPELDGQLYFIIMSDPDQPAHDWSKDTPPQAHMISCKVYAQYPLNQNPEWEEIRTMMAPYMKLYPFMKNRIDLTDPESFKIFAINPIWLAYNEPPTYSGPLGLKFGAIPYYMSRDINDPRLMPVSRDLSYNKLMTLLHYCKNLQGTPG